MILDGFLAIFGAFCSVVSLRQGLSDKLLEDGKQARVEIPNLHGKIETSFDVRREGNIISIRRQGSSKAWNVVSIGIDSVEGVENAEIEITNGSTRIKVNDNTNELNVRLR